MDRIEEYRALQAELEEIPPALEGTVQRAQARRRRAERRRRAWGGTFGGAAAVFALFVVLVNVSSPFAAACEGIPILKDLAAAVSFSHSLSSAVDHGYVQAIGQSQSGGGVAVELEYMMLDGGQIVFFGRVDAPEGVESCMVVADLPTIGGDEMQEYGITSSSIKPGELSTLFTINFDPDVFVFPEVLHLACRVELHWEHNGAAPAPAEDREEERRAPDAVVTFDVPVDRTLLGERRSLPVEQWIELDGNRFYIASLDLYPTFAKFHLEADGDNREDLRTLEFYLEDEHGNRYERGSASGVLAIGDSYWFESPYFQKPEHLTLHVTSAVWMEKGRERAVIDLESGEALSPLPEGVTPVVGRENGEIAVGLTAPLGRGSTGEHHIHYQLFYGGCRAPDGTEFEITQWSTVNGLPSFDGTEEEREELYDTHFTEVIQLKDWAWDTVEVGLYFSRRAEYGQPLVFPLS